jgi:hypothetical protein
MYWYFTPTYMYLVVPAVAEDDKKWQIVWSSFPAQYQANKGILQVPLVDIRSVESVGREVRISLRSGVEVPVRILSKDQEIGKAFGKARSRRGE